MNLEEKSDNHASITFDLLNKLKIGNFELKDNNITCNDKRKDKIDEKAFKKSDVNVMKSPLD